MQVPFIDLTAAYQTRKAAIDSVVLGVLAGGRYILDEQVRRFEQEFAAFNSSAFAVGVASGTDALLLSLRAFDIGPGDEVITVPHTAVATVAAIELSGARPFFVDVDPLTYTLDPAQLPGALTSATRAILPVHLYGQPAEMSPILEFARAHDLVVIEDCAQAHGALIEGRRAGSLGHAGAFSFYPTKNLGAFGDGGATVCQEEETAERLIGLRQYGWRRRYISETAGYNSRLDELQAAVLRVKLVDLENENAARRRIAALYGRLLQGTPLILPQQRPGSGHVYHLYVVQAPDRQALQAYLGERGIGTAVHYPLPVHLQPAYRRYGHDAGSFSVSERLAGSVLSLPMYPQLSDQQVESVCKAIQAFYR